MDLSDLLQQFGGNVTAQAPEGMDVESEFDQVAGSVSREELAGGVAEAFRSDETPPFASMLGGLFGNSGGTQQASVLNTLLSVAGPLIMQRMMSGGSGGRQQEQDSAGGLGGILGSVFGGGGGGMSQGGAGGLGDILGSVLGGGNRSGGGGLAGVLGQMMGSGGGMRQLTEEEAAQISPEEVQALAEEAQKADPSVIDRLSEVYAEHPTLIKSLGAGALALALSKIAQSQRR
jgi:hypothetical protein